MGKIWGVSERDSRFGARGVDRERKELGRWRDCVVVWDVVLSKNRKPHACKWGHCSTSTVRMANPEFTYFGPSRTPVHVTEDTWYRFSGDFSASINAPQVKLQTEVLSTI